MTELNMIDRMGLGIQQIKLSQGHSRATYRPV